MTISCQRIRYDNQATVTNERFDHKLNRLLNFSVPTLSVEQLHDIQGEVYIFDTRKEEEFLISHLPEARFMEYPQLDTNSLQGISFQDTIVLYCSVGYRSERIGEKLKKLGYQQVFNLYGSIFEWANCDYPLIDSAGQPTKKVHTYNRRWSKWVNDQNRKIW